MGESIKLENQLEQLIGNFFDAKTDADYFKKEADSYNKEIKELMTKMDIEDFTTEDGLVAKKTIQKRESFKEPQLIEKLLELNCKEAVELVPTINYDVVEDLIYNGKIDASILTDYKEIKEVVTLKVSKKKGE